MRGYFLLMLLLAVAADLFGCDCKQISKEEERDLSDIIFLGKVISSSNNYIEIEVVELFKSVSSIENRNYKIEKNSCSINPKNGELWLIYGRGKGDFLEVSLCGYSKNVYPNAIEGSSKRIPPKPMNYTDEELEMVQLITGVANEIDVNFDITNLRLDRIENLVIGNKLENEKTSEQSKQPFSRYDVYFLVLAVINLVALLLIFVKRKV